jgi:anti-sigma factor RsiW
MECNKWEEKGLLFTSGELSEEEAKAFNDHCMTCETCRKELQLYHREKESLFKPEMFEESPSPAVDKEIMRVCTRPVKPTMTSPIFSSFIKNTIYALLIFAVGFGGGAYFIAMKTDSDARNANIVRQQEQTIQQPQVVADQQMRADKEIDSAISDSTPQQFKRGDAEDIVPVGVQEQ